MEVNDLPVTDVRLTFEDKKEAIEISNKLIELEIPFTFKGSFFMDDPELDTDPKEYYIFLFKEDFEKELKPNL